MLRALGIPTRFLLSAVLGVFISLSAMTTATAGPGECPGGLIPSFIDNCYIDWVAANGFDPVVDPVFCEDDPSRPLTGMQLFTGGFASLFFVRVLETEFTLSVGGEASCLGQEVALTIPQRHFCRAAILRSVPWRLNCQKRVHSD